MTSSVFLPLTLTVTQMCGLKQERHWIFKLNQKIACCLGGSGAIRSLHLKVGDLLLLILFTKERDFVKLSQHI